jgi:predicted phage terminase large subunit-like protein
MAQFLSEITKHLKKELTAEEEQRAEAIRLGRESFWDFEKLRNPKFFKDDRPHLKQIADTLQALYEGRIVKNNMDDEWAIVGTVDQAALYEMTCRNLLLNIPPRHGKSYSLTSWGQWLFGKNSKMQIITVSYNGIISGRFSGHVRNGIDEKKFDDSKIVYSDIFPDTRIKVGDSARQLWALAGSFFSYLGTGFGGTLTGFGASVGIIDDPIKTAEEANNEDALDKQWEWYTDTFLSRLEENSIQVINMTRWSTKDLCGRILASDEAQEWYELKIKACTDEDQKVMACPSILSFKTYMKKRRRVSESIFLANYQQEPIDVQGSLYRSGFKTDDMPAYDEFERIINYTDTADEGTDSLCSISGGIIYGYIYVTDIYFTDAPMEITEPELARRLDKNKVRESIIESNNGGRGFARNVEQHLKLMKNKRCVITWFHQAKNKRSRIISNATNVMDKIIMPEGWEHQYPSFYRALMEWQSKGKNKHDDAPDCLTGLLEFAIGEVKGRNKAKILNRNKLFGGRL